MERKMQVTQTREYLITYRHALSYRKSYVVDSIVVQADSPEKARMIAQDDYYLEQILSVKEVQGENDEVF